MIVKLQTEHHMEFLSLKGGLHRLVYAYICQNATLLEITCHGSNIYMSMVLALNVLFSRVRSLDVGCY